MNNVIKYFDYDEVLIVYSKMVEASDGGLSGVRYEDGILSTLDTLQNDLRCPDFNTKLSYLVFKFCSGHYFTDGNKRISLTLGAYFLHKNGYHWQALVFMRQMESIVYHIAAGNIDESLLLRIINCFMINEEYDEELKLSLAHAMQGNKLGVEGEDYD